MVYSCGEEPSFSFSGSNSIELDLSDNFGVSVTKSFIGRVVDKNRQPLKDVIISIGEAEEVLTDVNGVFIVNDVSVFEKFAYIKASKIGYIDGSRSIVPTDGINGVTIMLIEEPSFTIIESGVTKTIVLPSGASVVLNGDYEKMDGTTYNGNVAVIVHELHPNDSSMSLKMPGMLYGANIKNEERLLDTFGMFTIKLMSATGFKLNIAKDSNAVIVLPIDPTLLTVAPSTIKLWSFDQEKGYWLEEGIAEKVGDTYVGNISHSSFWNYSIDFPTSRLCVNVKDANEQPISNQYISLSFSEYPYPTFGYTNNQGQICSLIPSNSPLQLKAFNEGVCGSMIIAEKNIGSFSKDAKIDFTISSNADVITEEVKGVLVNCNDNSITNGYSLIKMNDNVFVEKVNNTGFSTSFLRCANQNVFSFEGVDFDTNETTGVINYSFNTPSTNVGILKSCNTTTEFIQYSIDGVNFYNIPTIVRFRPVNSMYDFKPTIKIASNCFKILAVLNPDPYIGSYPYSVFGGGFIIPGFNILEATTSKLLLI